MKTKIIIALFILLGGMLVHAQKTTSLDEIIQAIDSVNPTAKMYEAQIRSMDEAAKGARSWMPTDFSTGLWMAPYNPTMWQKGDNGATGMGQYMLSVQQMFPNKKRQDAEAAYLERMSAGEKERMRYELTQLYADAKGNYNDLIILKRKISTVKENEKLLDFMIKDAEIRYRNGLDKLSAYYKAKAEKGNILGMRLELENEMNQKRIALNTLMHRNKLEAFEIDTNYIIKNYEAQSFDTSGLSSRSEIRAIDKDIQLAALQQVAEQAKIKPEFGVKYEHMFGFGGLPMQYTLMAMARIPIGRANRISRANAESLKWKSEALLQQKQKLLNEASGKAAGIFAQIEAKKQQVKLFEENIIPAMRKNYQVTQIAYQQNIDQLFTLFDSWDTLNKTQTEYFNQLQQLLNMQVELERTLELK